jgi:hypothetical protein
LAQWRNGKLRHGEGGWVLQAYIPGPCCGHPFVRDPEGALIQMHAGITGSGDLDPALYGWSGPVARIEIEDA